MSFESNGNVLEIKNADKVKFVGTSNTVIDNVTGRIGVGVDEPASALDVNGDVQFGTEASITNFDIKSNVQIGTNTVNNTLTVNGAITKTQYNPGEIIEEINSTCDGSTVVVKSGTYTMTNVTAALNGTGDFQVVTGSEIAYTPPPGTKRVYYRFWYHFDVTQNSGISSHLMKIDNDYVHGSACNIASNYASTDWHHACFPVSIEYTIRCDGDVEDGNQGVFTSWTSPKTLRVEYNEYSGSYESRLHVNTWWDHSGASTPYNIMKPHLTIRAIA